MTKDEMLARVETAFDMGLMTEERLRLLDRWVDFVMRFEAGQMSYVVDFLEAEKQRNGITSNAAIGNLASDDNGYSLIQLAAILAHPCQKCATDPHAWHTRSAFCSHRQTQKEE